jgi:hypothetical protein
MTRSYSARILGALAVSLALNANACSESGFSQFDIAGIDDSLLAFVVVANSDGSPTTTYPPFGVSGGQLIHGELPSFKVKESQTSWLITLTEETVRKQWPGFDGSRRDTTQVLVGTPPLALDYPSIQREQAIDRLPAETEYFAMETGSGAVQLVRQEDIPSWQSRTYISLPWDPEYCRRPEFPAPSGIFSRAVPAVFDTPLWVDANHVVVLEKWPDESTYLRLINSVTPILESCAAVPCVHPADIDSSTNIFQPRHRFVDIAVFRNAGQVRVVASRRAPQINSEEEEWYLDYFTVQGEQLQWNRKDRIFSETNPVKISRISVGPEGQVALVALYPSPKPALVHFSTNIEEPICPANAPLDLSSDLRPKDLAWDHDHLLIGAFTQLHESRPNPPDHCNTVGLRWTSYFVGLNFDVSAMALPPTTSTSAERGLSIWLGGASGKLGLLTATRGSPNSAVFSPVAPFLPESLQTCGPEFESSGPIADLGYDQSYLYITRRKCPRIAQMNIASECLSGLTPSPEPDPDSLGIFDPYVRLDLLDGRLVLGTELSNLWVTAP